MSLFLVSERSRKDPGYFRIGFVTLTIPPESIETAKITNNKEITPLRSRFSMYQKTGHSRWDVTITWKALVDYGIAGAQAPDYSEYQKVQQILAMFVAAPFVEVENEHIRQFIASQDPAYVQGDRLAFALQQLKIDTLGDVIDGLQVTLTMSLFNYRPYTQDFGYLGSTAGASVSANQSAAFQQYINNWIQNNIENAAATKQYPSLRNWRKQTPGSLTFNWRLYQAIQKTPVQPPVLESTPGQLGPSPAVLGAQKLNGQLSLADAIARFEGYGNNSNRASRNNNPGNIVYGHFAQQFPNRGSDGRFAIFATPQDGWHALNTLLTSSSYQGLNLSQIVSRYAPSSENNTQKYIAAVAQWTGVAPNQIPWNITSSNGPATPVTHSGTFYASQSHFARVASSNLKQQSNNSNALQVNAMTADGWVNDHETDLATFLYFPESLTLHDHEHGDASTAENRLYATQLSILFVNNLALLPREASQYPTYQHIGAAGTSISISLLSDGDVSQGEPQHPGLARVTSMVSILEDQYQRMRAQWRSITSVQRMQAVVLENQILNMLGIYGVMPRSVSTETLPDSPSLVQGVFACGQYENVFEQLTPFTVKGAGAYDKIWQSEVLNNSTTFQQAASKNHLLAPLQKLVQDKNSGNILPLFDYVSANAGASIVPMNISLSSQEQAQLRSLGMPGLTAENSTLAQRVKGSSSLNFNDFVALTTNPQAAANAQVASLRNTILARMQKATQSGSPDPVDLLYRQSLDYQVTNDRSLSSAVQQMEMTPDFQQKLLAAVDAKGPGAASDNSGHLAYKDLGLQNLTDRPGGYFVDHAANFRKEMQQYAKQTATLSVGTMDYFNKQVAQDLNLNSSDQNVQPNNGSAGDVQETIQNILQKTVIPESSMDRAFPTYKLFLIEDDNQGIFYMFDDFYSYSSVLNIEVIRYQDKPDAAVIQLSNIANLLSHKLYDGSVEGKFEYRNDPSLTTPTTASGEPIVSPSGSTTKQAVQKSLGGFTESVDLTSGFDHSGQKMPLQYFALQTGTKIQVRMGFSNNPDELFPVFSGVITQIEEGDPMTLMAQGFAVELTDSAPEDLDYNGFNIAWIGQTATRLLISAPEQLVSGSNLITNIEHAGSVAIHSFDRGPAMGGFALMGESGDVTGVMSKMLQTARAMHFGRWQVDVPIEESLKGYGFAQLTGGLLGLLTKNQTAQKISTLLLSGYDRSGENLLVNHMFTNNGDSVPQYVNRDFNCEQVAYGVPAMYYIPKDPAITPWRVIQDIKRRYPEFLALVKPYGFPFGCDATLVFASPNDFYISRLPLFGEAEIGQLTSSDSKYFTQWWSVNRSQFISLVKQTAGADLIHGNPAVADDQAAKIDNAGDQQPQVFTSIMNDLVEFVQKAETGYRLVPGDGSQVSIYRNLGQQLIHLQINAQQTIQQMQRSAQGLSNAPKPGDRVKPVRKWILVTSHSIIHNGITLNQNFYNSVRVDDYTFACNEGVKNIASHMRILDVDQLIIDPTHNVRELTLHNRYAASFLKDEVAKMYRGELVLAGMPEIDPADVLLLYDQATGMVGPVEVDSVIHTYDRETGYISIVKPKALVAVNEAMTAGLLSGVLQTAKSFLSATGSLLSYMGSTVSQQASGATLGAVGGLAVVGALEAPAIAAGAVGLAAISLTVMASMQSKLNPLFLMPLNRFDYPWVAGIDGWKLHDLHSSFAEKWQVFQTYELQPYLQAMRDTFPPSINGQTGWTNQAISLLGPK